MRAILVFVSLFLFAGVAAAGNEPVIAPAPQWLQPVSPATPDPARASEAVQILLINRQSYYSADTDDYFLEVVQQIGNAQGLQSAATIAIPWQPERSDLLVHSVHIIRGGTVIDLLANGQRFTVLRRENNLESAALDGVLTAVMQPEGLTVGDTLRVAYTIRKRGGALPLRAENLLIIPPAYKGGRLFLRDIWSDARRLQWRSTIAGPQAQQRRGPLGTEIVVRRDEIQGVKLIDDAPIRLALGQFYQVSEFQTWGDISLLLKPAYDRASEVTAGSPLQREIDRIAALSSDPRVRTLEALRSVQDQVRYFALLMGDGNYLPASAEQTWTRRYGDCKGKTALLLAMLVRLGIEAEAVTVSSIPGNPLNQYLPQLGLFDHILVRARIDGTTYWLDGTAQGDRDLADLQSTSYSFALPLRTGATLETIAFQPPARPLAETTTTYDASKELEGRVPVRIEVAMRGPVAAAGRTAIAQSGMEQVRQQLMRSPPEGVEIENLEIRDDQATGRLLIVTTGHKELRWENVPGASGRRYRFDNGTINWTPDFERPADQDQNAPFLLNHPYFEAQTEVVILPNGGAGFTIEGQIIDRTIAGSEIKRQLAIENGRAVARSSFRRVAPEIDARTARESLAQLREVNADRAFVRASITAALTAAASGPPRPARPIDTASGGEAEARQLVRRGYERLQSGRHAAALEDFDQAVRLTPQWSLPHANRAVALARLNRLDDAEAAANAALRLSNDDAIAHQALAIVMTARGRLAEALSEASRSIEIDSNVFTLGLRSTVLQRLGRFEEALPDLDKIIEREPTHAAARSRRAMLLAYLGRTDDALAAMRGAIEADAANYSHALNWGDLLSSAGQTAAAEQAYGQAIQQFDALMRAAGVRPSEDLSTQAVRAELLARVGRYDEALAVTERALARRSDSVRMLAARCLVRVYQGTDVARGVRDCDQALRYERANDYATAARAMGRLRLGQWTGAIADFTEVLSWDADNANALYGRGLAKMRSGDREGGQRDMSAALGMDIQPVFTFAKLGFPFERASAPASPVAAPSPATTP